MHARMPGARHGSNLIEVLIAAAIAGTVIMGLGGFILGTMKANGTERDKAYAMQKALQMMEEMAAHVPTGPSDPGPDAYATGPSFQLTTVNTVAHEALSGNPSVNGYYKYVRQINSVPVSGDPNARRVTVQIWYNHHSSTPAVPNSDRPLAAITNVLRSNISAVGPKHVLDLYIISIENLPHVYLNGTANQYYPSASDARAAFENALLQIQSQSPWLEFRKHYITRLSEGRDSYYRPYVNDQYGVDNNVGTRDALSSVYFYPGRIETATDSTKYYDYSVMGGRVMVGTSTGNTKMPAAVAPNTADTMAYGLCDQFNQAVRYPREYTFPTSDPDYPNAAFGQADTSRANATGVICPLSLRQFLEDLLTDNTEKYRNAVVVNLNGELFPTIPLRNYSDAAKDPADSDSVYQKRRLVTHPLKLSTPVAPALTAQPVKLLVYPYMEDGSTEPAASNKDDYVFMSTKISDAHGTARITIKNLKPYLADAGYDSTLGTPNGTVDLNDVKITVIQRHRTSNGNGNDYTTYKAAVEWPYVSGIETEDADQFDHSGPHACHHLEDNAGGRPDHAGAGDHSAAATYDPQWVNTNDLQITLTDLDYDARPTQTGGASTNYYGIDQTHSAFLLHGMAYFPDPWLPDLTQTTDSNWDRPRNTARVCIEFMLNPATAVGKRFEVVTQLEKSDSSWASDPPAAGTPADPSISKTWFYAGNATDWDSNHNAYYDSTAKKYLIPPTDQVQLVGDPRHNPYLDFRKNQAYNPYWTDFTSGHADYNGCTNDSTTDATKYAGGANQFVPVTDLPASGTAVPLTYNVSYPNTAKSWNGIKFNVPAYMKLWHDAFVRNSIVFMNPSGMAMHYLGQGGEFDCQNKVNDLGNLAISKKPYDGSSNDANAESSELFSGHVRLIQRNGGDNWYSKPWLGELYPTAVASGYSAWSDWSTTGNLPTGTGSNHFLRTKLSQVTNWDALADKTDGENLKDAGDLAFPSFLNSKTSSASSAFNLIVGGAGDQAAQTTTMKTDSASLHMALIDPGKTPYGMQLSGGAAPPGYPFLGSTNLSLVDWVDSPYSPQGYYYQKDNTKFSVSPIWLQATSTDTHSAFIVPSNHVPSGGVPTIDDMFNVAVTSMVSAYLDASREAIGQYNVKVLPRVKVTSPQKDQVFSIATGSAALTWYCRWAKPDGQPYSPLFPSQTYTTYTSSTPGKAFDVVFHLKYKLLPSGSYVTAKVSGYSTGGVPLDAGDGSTPTGVTPLANSPAYPSPVTATWDISGLTAGNYLLRIEAYRKDGTQILGSNYAYHEIPVTLGP